MVLLMVGTYSTIAGTIEKSEAIILSKQNAQFQAGFIETSIDDRMVVALKNPTKEALELEILDDDGKAIYSEMIHSEESFIRRYDFSELSDGNYRVKVSGNSGEFFEEILLR